MTLDELVQDDVKRAAGGEFDLNPYSDMRRRNWWQQGYRNLDMPPESATYGECRAWKRGNLALEHFRSLHKEAPCQ